MVKCTKKEPFFGQIYKCVRPNRMDSKTDIRKNRGNRNVKYILKVPKSYKFLSKTQRKLSI